MLIETRGREGMSAEHATLRIEHRRLKDKVVELQRRIAMWKTEAAVWQLVATAYGGYRDDPDTVPGLGRKMREVLASSEHTDDDSVEENRVRVRKSHGTLPADRIVSRPVVRA